MARVLVTVGKDAPDLATTDHDSDVDTYGRCHIRRVQPAPEHRHSFLRLAGHHAEHLSSIAEHQREEHTCMAHFPKIP